MNFRLLSFRGYYTPFLETRKCFIVWVGGWVGWWVGGDLFPPLIVFSFGYVNKQNVASPNMVFKVVNGYYIKSYDQFKFKIRKITDG